MCKDNTHPPNSTDIITTGICGLHHIIFTFYKTNIVVKNFLADEYFSICVAFKIAFVCMFFSMESPTVRTDFPG